MGDGSNRAVDNEKDGVTYSYSSSTSCFLGFPVHHDDTDQTGTGMCPCDDVFISFIAQYISYHVLV